MDDRSHAHRDISIEPQDQELTAYLYQPYLEAYEAVCYPSIWKARHDDRYTETLQHYGLLPFRNAENARTDFLSDMNHHIEVMVWDYFQMEVSDGEFYSFIRKHIEELAVVQAALLDLTVHVVENDVVIEFEEIPDWFKDVPSFEGAGSLLMERNLRYAEEAWEKTLHELHLIKRQDFLTAGSNRKYRMTLTALQKIVGEAWDEMQEPTDERYPVHEALPDLFDYRIRGVMKFLMSCVSDAEDVDLLKTVRRWDRYLTWFAENGDGLVSAERMKGAVEAMEPLADMLGYDLSHHLPQPRLT